jgi:hypothetical protein
MFWFGTKKHPRVDFQVTDHNDALERARRLGLRVFHIFDDEQHEQMRGTWRQNVLGKWDFISAR